VKGTSAEEKCSFTSGEEEKKKNKGKRKCNHEVYEATCSSLGSPEIGNGMGESGPGGLSSMCSFELASTWLIAVFWDMTTLTFICSTVMYSLCSPV